MRRVVVTGIGVVSSLGPTREHFWNALKEGSCGIRPLVLSGNLFLSFKNGAQVLDFDSSQAVSSHDRELMDRFSQLGVVAGEEAIKDSGIELNPDVAMRTATITGSCLGGILSEDEQYLALYGKGKSRAHPMTIPRVMANAAACHISMKYGLGGHSMTVSTACASSSHALGHAFWLVRNGIAEIAISGGSEAPFALGHLKAWEALRVISPDTCRPFSMNRTGTILGEGAAMLLLEPAERAVARGAHIYAEIAGYGSTSDAQHLTQPSVDGAARAMALALEDAGLHPEQVTYVNAHGTATKANDITETKAIKNVLGSHSHDVAISSTKSLHGHLLGAAGAIEAAATCLAIERSHVPPTGNYTEPDPECDLDVVPNISRPVPIEAALSNSFAFGGMNAVLAFRRWL